MPVRQDRSRPAPAGEAVNYNLSVCLRAFNERPYDIPILQLQKMMLFRHHFRIATGMFAPITNRERRRHTSPRRRGGGVFNALKTSGSYCYGYALKLPSSLQSSSVAESGGLANKTFYQKVFWLLFFKKVTASPVPITAKL